MYRNSHSVANTQALSLSLSLLTSLSHVFWAWTETVPCSPALCALVIYCSRHHSCFNSTSLHSSYSIHIIVISSFPTVFLHPLSLSYFCFIWLRTSSPKLKQKSQNWSIFYIVQHQSILTMDSHAEPDKKMPDQKKAITFIDDCGNWPYPVSV